MQFTLLIENKKNNTIIALDAFAKIRHPFMIRILSKSGIEGNFSNLIKTILYKIYSKYHT